MPLTVCLGPAAQDAIGKTIRRVGDGDEVGDDRSDNEHGSSQARTSLQKRQCGLEPIVVETPEGFVQKEHGRIWEQGAGEHQPLALAR